MRRSLFVGLLVTLFSAAGASAAWCADVVGVVGDAQHSPVAGVEISVKNSAGKFLAAARTDTDGRYQLSQLPQGTCTFTLDPRRSDFKGGDAVANLGPKGLTINWMISATTAAIAMATEGTEVAVAGDPFGYSPEQFSALVGGVATVVTGGVLGGYAAAGGFSGGSGHGPAASPAM